MNVYNVININRKKSYNIRRSDGVIRRLPVPSTIDEAVEQIVDNMDYIDKLLISKSPQDNLAHLQIILKYYIMSRLRLWAAIRLDRSLNEVSMNEMTGLFKPYNHKDIIKMIWERLR